LRFISEYSPYLTKFKGLRENTDRERDVKKPERLILKLVQFMRI